MILNLGIGKFDLPGSFDHTVAVAVYFTYQFVLNVSATYYSIGGNICKDKMAFDFSTEIGSRYHVTFVPY